MEPTSNLASSSEQKIEFTGVSPYFCDFNSTTPIPIILQKELAEAFGQHWFNLSAPYLSVEQENKWVRTLRHRLNSLLADEGVSTIFCASATEAINQAIYSLSLNENAILITTDIEHSAVIGAASRWFSGRTKKIKALNLLSENYEELNDALSTQEDAYLVMQAANNETGTILPIRKIREQFPALNILLDASQILGKHPDFLEIFSYADGLILSPHKFYGPKGIGILSWTSRLGDLHPLIIGGGQEYGLRSGTENIPILYLTHKWLELIPNLMSEHEKIAAFSKRFETLILKELKGSFSVANTDRLTNTVTICFPGIVSESGVAALDAVGVMASTGSACKAGTREPSKTYLALGLNWEDARSVIRFSLGIPNLKTSAEALAEKVVNALRVMRD